MTSEANEENKPDGRCLLGNWVEERATALLDTAGPRTCVLKYGHTGILTMDVAAKVQGTSTFKEAFNAPKILGVRQKGRRTELLENDLIKRISDQIHAELNADPPAPEMCSVTKADFTVEGFKSVRATLSMDHDYTTEQAITFWSENYQKIQGVTAVKTKDSPFKRNATFSTPIGEQLDQLDDTVPYPSDNDANLYQCKALQDDLLASGLTVTELLVGGNSESRGRGAAVNTSIHTDAVH